MPIFNSRAFQVVKIFDGSGSYLFMCFQKNTSGYYGRIDIAEPGNSYFRICTSGRVINYKVGLKDGGYLDEVIIMEIQSSHSDFKNFSDILYFVYVEKLPVLCAGGVKKNSLFSIVIFTNIIKVEYALFVD